MKSAWKQGSIVCTFLRLSSCKLWLPSHCGLPLESLINQSLTHILESVFGLCCRWGSHPQLVTVVAVSDVPGSGTRVHTPAHGGSEGHNELPNSILLNEPKPLGKHMPSPLQLVLSPDELSY
ncbi:hypothetical protein Tco_0748560 [Tanacetum coccineum]|uniref:Uncharacterized protein n=1 Tax=Tanacetum coccineum TaxID=301880 RepID=A0ABQ4YW08_9ASTR